MMKCYELLKKSKLKFICYISKNVNLLKILLNNPDKRLPFPFKTNIYCFKMGDLYNTTTESISSIDDNSTYFKETSDKCIWEDIMTKREEDYRELNDFFKSRDTELKVPPHAELQFLEDNVFPMLLPILEKTLKKAKLMESLKGQRNLFNGIDYIAECLWNKNEKYPERANKPLNIFVMPWVQQHLIEKPRKVFPLSWILTKVEAVTLIQSYVRGYFVRRREDVQEMRQFWRTLEIERYYENAKQDMNNLSLINF